MTLTPLIVAMCVNAGPSYNDACKAALEQGAAQSGFAGKFEYVTKNAETTAIRYIDPSAEVEVVAAALGYTYQLGVGHQATVALPNPGLKNSSLSLSVGKEAVKLGFIIGF